MQGGPDELVQPIQTGTGRFPPENYDLLPEGKNFRCVLPATAEEHVDCRLTTFVDVLIPHAGFLRVVLRRGAIEAETRQLDRAVSSQPVKPCTGVAAVAILRPPVWRARRKSTLSAWPGTR